MAVVFRRQYDGLPIGKRVFKEAEQLDQVERAGYRSTKQMVHSLLAAGQRLVEFRATEFDGVLTPDPFQGSPDQVDLDSRMDDVVQSGKAAAERVRAATARAQELRRKAKIQQAKDFLKEAQGEASSSPAPEGGGPS